MAKTSRDLLDRQVSPDLKEFEATPDIQDRHILAVKACLAHRAEKALLATPETLVFLGKAVRG